MDPACLGETQEHHQLRDLFRLQDPPKRDPADCLLTRDAGFYRDYFKGLKIINPAA